jgi:hypothetical protein
MDARRAIAARNTKSNGPHERNRRQRNARPRSALKLTAKVIEFLRERGAGLNDA